jgi:hypothetical protein
VNFDLLQEPPEGGSTSGFSILEQDGEGRKWRWALGPESTVVVSSSAEQVASLTLELSSPMVEQTVEIILDGERVDSMQASPAAGFVRRTIRVPLRPGDNWLAFRYSDWNGRVTTFAPGDFRPIAVRFTCLSAAAVNEEKA